MEEKKEEAKERERYRREGPLPMSPENSLFARKQLWVRCEMCGVILYISHLPQYHHTCKGCGENIPMTPEERVASLIDDHSWRPIDELFSAGDPLVFNDKKSYTERLAESQERTESQDAIRVGTGTIDGIPVALGVMNFEFMGGSMGSVVGEVITRLIEGATLQGVMLIMVCASGGARMQEGILSLMQMAKISAALYSHQCTARLSYISILTTPTTGGVTASFAMLGDVIIAEPKAVIGFAGRRVIEQTLGETLPDDFQTAEYLMDHGLVDLIIHRKYLKSVLTYILNFNVSGFYRQAGTIYALGSGDVPTLGDDATAPTSGGGDIGSAPGGEGDEPAPGFTYYTDAYLQGISDRDHDFDLFEGWLDPPDPPAPVPEPDLWLDDDISDDDISLYNMPAYHDAPASSSEAHGPPVIRLRKPMLVDSDTPASDYPPFKRAARPGANAPSDKGA